MNDVDEKVVELHRFLQEQSSDIELFIENMYELIREYGLSLSELGKNSEIKELKKEFKKTYFAKYNNLNTFLSLG